MGEEKKEKIKVINSDVYCIECGVFLGATCDPFSKKHCEKCFPERKEERE